jgi:cell fate (sporulation/competence/biofilm development) regulator YlbF (YheA/YmcA/DUF963 family)
MDNPETLDEDKQSKHNIENYKDKQHELHLTKTWGQPSAREG